METIGLEFFSFVIKMSAFNKISNMGHLWIRNISFFSNEFIINASLAIIVYAIDK